MDRSLRAVAKPGSRGGFSRVSVESLASIMAFAKFAPTPSAVALQQAMLPRFPYPTGGMAEYGLALYANRLLCSNAVCISQPLGVLIDPDSGLMDVAVSVFCFTANGVLCFDMDAVIGRGIWYFGPRCRATVSRMREAEWDWCGRSYDRDE